MVTSKHTRVESRGNFPAASVDHTEARNEATFRVVVAGVVMKIVKALSIQKPPHSLRHATGSLLPAFRVRMHRHGATTSRRERVDRES
jgi:hypothetical protein